MLKHSDFTLNIGMSFRSQLAESKRAKTQICSQLLDPLDMINQISLFLDELIESNPRLYIISQCTYIDIAPCILDLY